MSYLRNSRSLRRLLVPLAVIVAMFALTASSAPAAFKYHSNVLSSNEWSHGGWNTNALSGNVATYEGAGQISVCSKVFVLGFGYVANSCGLNGAGNALNVVQYKGNLAEPFVKNNSAFAHTINGYAY